MLCPLPSVESSTMLKASGELDSAATTMQSPGDNAGSGGGKGGDGGDGGAGGSGGGDGGDGGGVGGIGFTVKPVGALYDDEPPSQLPVLEIAAARATLLPTLSPVYFQASS